MNNKKVVSIVLFLSLSSIQASALADQRLTLGARLLFAGWNGDNGSMATTFDSDKGGQLAFSLSYQRDKFYAAISLQNGNYTFDNDAPDQFAASSRNPSSNAKIEHQEMDLIAGYYILPRLSIFLDLKGVRNTWSDDNYQQSFAGLGLGASTFIPMENDWTFFASAGFIGQGDLKDSAEVTVGEGNSGALELGFIHKLGQYSSFSSGLKFRNYRFEYLDGTSQDYSINALFFGYNHSFVL